MTQTAQEFTRAASLLKAMAHPERLAILFRLACGAQNLDELAEYTGLPPGELSRHIDRLRRMGIVGCTRYLRIVEYRLSSDTVRRLLAVLDTNPQHIQTKRKNPA